MSSESHSFIKRRSRATDFGATAVYAYLRASDKTPYYVGVSTGPSRVADQKGHRKHGISVPKNRDLIVFLKGQLTKDQAAHYEKFYIAHYGRKDINTGILRNKSAGGEGLQEPSPETRAKISAASKGRPMPLLARIKCLAYSRLPKTEQHRERIRNGQPSLGKTHDPEHLAALRESYAAIRKRNADSLGLTLAQYESHLKRKSKISKQQAKLKNAEEAKRLGMSKRSHLAWKKAGCPADHTPYIKNASTLPPEFECLSPQDRRKAERKSLGLSERQYRLWVKDKRPSNVEHYQTLYGKPGRPSKSITAITA